MVAVLLYRCTVPLPWLYMRVGGLGGLELSDPALIGLLIGVLLNPRSITFPGQKWLWGVVCWYAISSAYTFFFGFNDSRRSDALNEFIRYGLSYVIPVAIVLASRQERKWLVRCCFLVAGLCCLLQSYIITSGDYNFFIRHGLIDPSRSADVDSVIQIGGMYKISFQGLLLTVAVFFFCLSSILMHWQEIGAGRWFLLPLTFGCSLAIYSFRSKSLMVLVGIGLLALLVTPGRALGNRVLMAILLLGALALGLRIVESRSEMNFLTETFDRFRSDTAEWDVGSVGSRIGDNIRAVELVGRYPLFGIGRPDLTLGGDILSEGMPAFDWQGYDAHALLMLAVFIGLPGAVMAALALTGLMAQIPWMQLGRASWTAGGCVCGFSALVALGMGNAVPVLTQRPELTAFMVFWGLALAEVPNLADYRGVKNSKVKHCHPTSE